MKILLAKRRALGDTVFLSSTVSNLASALPEAEISVLVPGAFAPVLEGHPAVKKIFAFEAGFFPLLRDLRRQRFDHFLQLHHSPRNRWLASLSGASHVNFSVQNNETEKAYGKHPNALEWDGFFLRTLFGNKISVPGPAPRIYLSPAEKERGKEIWQRFGVDSTKIIFFGLGASRATKRWPAAHFARLAELLRDRLDLIPALVPGPGEVEERFCAEVLDQMRARALRAVGSSGKGDFVHVSGLGVRALAQALSCVRAYVGNDSGPKHVAAAVGTRTVTFFGPEDPGEWHPYARSDHPVFFQEALPCRREDGGRWCGLEVCTEERHRCMVDTDPLEVVRVVGEAGALVADTGRKR